MFLESPARASRQHVMPLWFPAFPFTFLVPCGLPLSFLLVFRPPPLSLARSHHNKQESCGEVSIIQSSLSSIFLFCRFCIY
jgi:hypothetical protein